MLCLRGRALKKLTELLSGHLQQWLLVTHTCFVRKDFGEKSYKCHLIDV